MATDTMREAFTDGDIARIFTEQTGFMIDAQEPDLLGFARAIEQTTTTRLEAELREARRSAERYRWLQARVFADRGRRGMAYFGLPLPRPVNNPMFGSVAQHFDEAIDAAIDAARQPPSDAQGGE
jgi:hypothetical protein